MLSDKQLDIVQAVLELYIDGDQIFVRNLIKKVVKELGYGKASEFVGICIDIRQSKCGMGTHNVMFWNQDTLGRYFLDIYKIITKYEEKFNA